jgi:galactan 5-O-arabinofuranosyltransferase
VAGGYGTLWAFALVAVVALGYLLSRSRPAEQWTGGPAGVASGLMSFPLLAGLNGTAQPLLGAVFADQGFRTEYVTRLATGWGLHDYTFAHLPAFYPPDGSGWVGVGPRWRGWSPGG